MAKTNHSQKSNTTANVEKERYDAEFSSPACHLDDEANAVRFNQVSLVHSVFKIVSPIPR